MHSYSSQPHASVEEALGWAAVLRQLRDGYAQRPDGFPHSIVLRDVRDYRIRSSAEHVTIAGGSAFNVKGGSLLLGDFSEADVHVLLAQHTAETGQPFTADALATVWRQTRGPTVAGERSVPGSVLPYRQ